MLVFIKWVIAILAVPGLFLLVFSGEVIYIPLIFKIPLLITIVWLAFFRSTDPKKEEEDAKRYIQKLFEQKWVNKKVVIDYETSQAMENECPICFSSYTKDDAECKKCGHKLKESSLTEPEGS